MLLNLYVVNGREVGDPKYAYKLKWLEQLHDLVDERYDMSEKVVLTGDFNITFDDRDVHDPEAWRDKVLCSEPERDALARIMGCGLSDAFRKHNQDAGQYTWWDFRSRGWQRKAGMRIDHFLMSDPALDACTAVHVALEARDGPKPSDHAPVVARLA
jgi:exodeoxyribonuclease-3